jgi:threonine dehydratase
MKASIDAGHLVTLDRSHSIADGLMPVRPGDLTFAHVRRFVDRVVTVEDDQIIDAVLWIFEHARIVAEPSGAAAVAAALAGAAAEPAGGAKVVGPVVAIVSGGNMGMEKLEELRRNRINRSTGETGDD